MFSKKTKMSFAAKYDICPDTGCWLWNAGKARHGYGAFWTSRKDAYVGRKWYRAHRFSYEMHKGHIPDGLVVMHKCDNPACVNPDHLTIGTQKDNMTDRDLKKRGRVPMLPEKELRDMAAHVLTSGQSDASLADRYGVSRGHIWKIKNKKYAWQWRAGGDVGN